MSSRDSEGRRRKKEHDRESDGSRRKDKDRHRASRSSRKRSSSSKNKRHDSLGRQQSVIAPQATPRSSRKTPEMDRAGPSSPAEGSRRTLPYPTFSKAHSKEAVGSRESLVRPRMSLYTPDPTDIGQQPPVADDHQGMKPAPIGINAIPPSPPLTAAEPERKETTGVDTPKVAAEMTEDEVSEQCDLNVSKPKPMDKARSVDVMNSKFGQGPLPEGIQEPSHPQLQKSNHEPSHGSLTPRRTISPWDKGQRPIVSSVSGSGRPVTELDSPIASTDSNATSVAPHRITTQRPPALVSHTESSPSSYMETSSPRTPTPREASFPSSGPDRLAKLTVEILSCEDADQSGIDVHEQVDGHNVEPSHILSQTTTPFPPAPPPPPPPPPLVAPTSPPKVDYLVQFGGLSKAVPRTLLSALTQQSVASAWQNQSLTRNEVSSIGDVSRLFDPFHNLLEDYSQVLAKQGSIAVATGYRSVARRLLDRLEAVFARNISSESCSCIMCRTQGRVEGDGSLERGVSWGEILEYVSGRRELPPWPPFSIFSHTPGLGPSYLEPTLPMQKLDIDVPEEYRDHYVRQSKKTKQAVSHWLASQPELPTSPPDEVDDETLTFAMLTHLEPGNRQLFTALLRGLPSLPASRAPTPLPKFKTDSLIRTALALQRLYRLPRPPRDPESAMFLLKNPNLHGVLATLAAISPGEWEVLVSGRFDGFLWSGADNVPSSTISSPSMFKGLPQNLPGDLAAGPPSRALSPEINNPVGPSRSPVPFNPTLSSPPAHKNSSTMSGTASGVTSAGAPVQLDEETEIAVLAEVEREIYLGMEALEDAFEALHCKAEGVRRALRERSAGLAMAAQSRRGPSAEAIEVRLGTPAEGLRGGIDWETDTDDGFDEVRSELAPDDSASNISYSRRRRPGRRNERRTPAPVEEEDEDYED